MRAVLVVLLLLASPALAAKGSTADGSYTYKDSLAPVAVNPPAFDWIDSRVVAGGLRAIPTDGPIDDPNCATILLGGCGWSWALTNTYSAYIDTPFDIQLFGKTIPAGPDVLGVNYHGFLHFGPMPGSPATPQNMASSGPDDILAPFWTHTHPGPFFSAYYGAFMMAYCPTIYTCGTYVPPGVPEITYRTVGTSPDRIFVVSYQNFTANFDQSNEHFTAQVQFHEDGTIEYHYLETHGSKWPGSIGIRGSSAASEHHNYKYSTTSGAAFDLAKHAIRYAPAPEGKPDFYTWKMDTLATIPASNGVLANDVDVNNDVLEINTTFGSGPSFASSFLLHANGSFEYEPMPGFLGIDTFTYRPDDGAGPATADVLVTIEVVDVPPPVVVVTPPTVLPTIKVHVGREDVPTAAGGPGVTATDADLDGIDDARDPCPMRGGCDPNREVDYPVIVYAPQNDMAKAQQQRVPAGTSNPAPIDAVSPHAPQAASVGVGGIGGGLALFALVAAGLLLFFVLRPRA